MSTDLTTEDVLDVFEEVLRLARVGLRHEEEHGRGDGDDDELVKKRRTKQEEDAIIKDIQAIG